MFDKCDRLPDKDEENSLWFDKPYSKCTIQKLDKQLADEKIQEIDKSKLDMLEYDSIVNFFKKGYQLNWPTCEKAIGRPPL